MLLAIGLAGSLVLSAWLTGEWVAGPIDPRRAHPGYFIPALGPGMIGALTAGTLGHANLAWQCLGLGLLSWIMLGSVILHRLMFGPGLPAPLAATPAIEIAPPAVAAIAYLTLDGGRVDPVLLGLSGFCVLMVLGQVRLLPIYRRVPFFPNWPGARPASVGRAQPSRSRRISAFSTLRRSSPNATRSTSRCSNSAWKTVLTLRRCGGTSAIGSPSSRKKPPSDPLPWRF